MDLKSFKHFRPLFANYNLHPQITSIGLGQQQQQQQEQPENILIIHQILWPMSDCLISPFHSFHILLLILYYDTPTTIESKRTFVLHMILLFQTISTHFILIDCGDPHHHILHMRSAPPGAWGVTQESASLLLLFLFFNLSIYGLDSTMSMFSL